MIHQYKTLEEAYIVLYCEAEFSKRGFTVDRNRENLIFSLFPGKRKAFDFSIEKENKKVFVDVDMGYLREEDFFAQLDKVHELCGEICIVAKDLQTLLNHTKLYCFKWIKDRFGGIEHASGKVRFNFTTLEDLIFGEEPWDEVII